MSNRRNENYLLGRAIAAGIDDPRELANFMAQMQVESGGFSRLSENLNYSGQRLLQIFPGRNGLRTAAEAAAISAAGPDAVANKVYGGDWGNRNLGNTEPNDGWRYRGRGFIQLTGRSRYAEAARYTGIDLLSHPELAEEADTAATIAIEYWKREVVRRGHQFDVTAATHDINKGENGLHERRLAAAEWEASFRRKPPQQLLAARDPSSHPESHGGSPLERQATVRQAERMQGGSSGQEVRELQSLLDRLGYNDDHGQRLSEDGDFGQRTGQALKAFQRAHGLQAVGYVGPKTHAALEAARRDGPSPLDPAHPDHVLQQQVARALGAMERSLGRTADAGTARLGAALLVTARQAGLARVDHVLLGVATAHVQAGANAFVVQGAPDDPASRRAHVPTQQALATPVDASWARLAQGEPPPRDEPARAWGHAHPLAARHGEHGEGARRFPAP